VERALVLGAIQALKGAPTRLRFGRSGYVDQALQRLSELSEGISSRPRATGRWHHPGTQLRDDPLGDLGLTSSVCHVELLQ
jgi:hypothetical protein